MTYRTHHPNLPARIVIDIRTLAGDWLPVHLLDVQAGWVCVDDGEGSLWVVIEHIHKGDWPKLAIF